MSHAVTITDAIKRYGSFQALNGVNLSVSPGEFFTLLGPSGCGKTTLLRMIAGFNSVDEGEIRFDDRVMNNVEAHKRDIGMVFQNYAIFPHLNVAENVAYGLKAKKIPKDEIRRRVQEALELVQIEKLASRKPNELSGGQQQRVALARAFVVEPTLLLMDEPLSNLDAKLRVQMRSVIKRLQRRLGITTIYVTHDQEEALAISDRIAIMKAGDIMQVGTPEQVYKRPENAFVAGFIGVSNFIKCDIDTSENGGGACVSIPNQSGPYTLQVPLVRSHTGQAILSVRPEQLFFLESGGLCGEICMSTFLGDFVEYEIKLSSGQTVQLNEYTKDADAVQPDGKEVCIGFNAGRIRLYESESGGLLSC